MTEEGEEEKRRSNTGETRRNLYSIPNIINQFDSHFYSNITEKNVDLFGINRNSLFESHVARSVTHPFKLTPVSSPIHVFRFTFLQVRVL